MRRFRIVAAQEFKETVRSTPFKVITAIYAAVVILALAAALLGGFTGDMGELIVTDDPDMRRIARIAVDDRSGADILPALEKALPLVSFDKMELDSELIESAINDSGVDACIIINSPLEFECYEKTELYGESCADMVASALERIHKIETLKSKSISVSDIYEILDTSAQYTTTAVGGYDMGKYIMNTALVMIFFIVIALYGQMVATRVATEKSSRTMEVLATAVSPVELLCGKVIGVGLAGISQFAVFAAVIFGLLGGAVTRSGQLAPLLSGMADLSALDAVWLMLYFILGFTIIAFIYGGLGSMVSQVEDLSGLMSLPLYIFMVGYMISLLSTSSGSSNTLLRVASFVPFWSPVTMFARMSLESVPVWQVLVSLLLLALGAAGTAVLSARMYRTGMLRYGRKPALRELIDALK